MTGLSINRNDSLIHASPSLDKVYQNDALLMILYIT